MVANFIRGTDTQRPKLYKREGEQVRAPKKPSTRDMASWCELPTSFLRDIVSWSKRYKMR